MRVGGGGGGGLRDLRNLGASGSHFREKASGFRVKGSEFRL